MRFKSVIAALLASLALGTFPGTAGAVAIFNDTGIAPTDPTDNFYLGFSGILFDEIRIDLPDGTNTMLLDNIQFAAAPALAAEPGSLALLALALVGLALVLRRKR